MLRSLVEGQFVIPREWYKTKKEATRNLGTNVTCVQTNWVEVNEGNRKQGESPLTIVYEKALPTFGSELGCDLIEIRDSRSDFSYPYDAIYVVIEGKVEVGKGTEKHILEEGGIISVLAKEEVFLSASGLVRLVRVG